MNDLKKFLSDALLGWMIGNLLDLLHQRLLETDREEERAPRTGKHMRP